MIIQNGLVFGPEGRFEQRDLYINGEHIICEEPKDQGASRSGKEPFGERIDARGLYVIPGLVDVHIHGAAGEDASDGSVEGLQRMAAYLKSTGVTSFCPTTMSLPEEQTYRAVRAIAEAAEQGMEKNGARIVGIHMEGPFLKKEKKGAQKEEYLQEPSADLFAGLKNTDGGLIRILTMAPELPGAMDFIRRFGREVHISLGHTLADYETAKAAFAAGASGLTHTFNAMPPLLHRNPGMIGAAVETPKVYAELICDGQHVHPSMVLAAYKLFGAERLVLVSDAMRALGEADGDYMLGGQIVCKEGNKAAFADGTLAGSVTGLADAMRNAVRFGLPLEAAVLAAATNPAKRIGREKEIGQLIPGAFGDVILMDKDLQFVSIL